MVAKKKKSQYRGSNNYSVKKKKRSVKKKEGLGSSKKKKGSRKGSKNTVAVGLGLKENEKESVINENDAAAAAAAAAAAEEDANLDHDQGSYAEEAASEGWGSLGSELAAAAGGSGYPQYDTNRRVRREIEEVASTRRNRLAGLVSALLPPNSNANANANSNANSNSATVRGKKRKKSKKKKKKKKKKQSKKKNVETVSGQPGALASSPAPERGGEASAPASTKSAPVPASSPASEQGASSLPAGWTLVPKGTVSSKLMSEDYEARTLRPRGSRTRAPQDPPGT
jgi:hypothetical protein